MNNRKRDFEDGTKENGMSVPLSRKEDYLSQLPNDCLLDIFERIDHDDLDEIEMLSRRHSNLVDHARMKAVKVEASELFVSQTFTVGFNFHMTYNGQNFFMMMDNTVSGLKKKMRKQVRKKNKHGRLGNFLTQDPAITSAVTDNTSRLLNRFGFRYCVFQSISIDDNLLQFMERCASFGSLFAFDVVRCVFDKNLSSNGRAKFVSMLLSARPTLLALSFACSTPFIDANFLTNYAKAVPDAHLVVKSLEPKLLLIDCCAVDGLESYVTLIMPRLLYKTDSLIPVLLARLRLKKTGIWQFLISRDFNRSDVVESLGSDLVYIDNLIREPNSVQIRGMTYHVHITKFFESPLWKMEANFSDKPARIY